MECPPIQPSSQSQGAAAVLVMSHPVFMWRRYGEVRQVVSKHKYLFRITQITTSNHERFSTFCHVIVPLRFILEVNVILFILFHVFYFPFSY